MHRELSRWFQRLNLRIVVLLCLGYVDLLAGSSTGVSGYADGSTALFSNPHYIAPYNGDLYVSDLNNHRVRIVTVSGVVSTFAGNGAATNVDGVGVQASLGNPMAITVSTAGTVFVGGSDYCTIRSITTAGNETP